MDERMLTFTDRVVRGEDGMYRWYYDMDMRKNHYFRNVLYKVMGTICAVILITLVILFSGSGSLNGSAFGLMIGLPVGMFLLTVIGYHLAAGLMHGNYRVFFEMDEESIRLVRKEKTQRMMNALGPVTFAAGRAAGSPGSAFRSGAMISAAAASGYTRFDSVRGMKEHPEWDAVNLRELTGANQIWIPPQDYAFITGFLREHIRKN